MRPRQICNIAGCPNIATYKGRCSQHQVPAWQGRRGFEGYGPEYLRNRRIVLKEEPVCRLCGARPSVTADHIVPVSQGGTHDRANLRGVCKQCHDARSQRQAAAARWG